MYGSHKQNPLVKPNYLYVSSFSRHTRDRSEAELLLFYNKKIWFSIQHMSWTWQGKEPPFNIFNVAGDQGWKTTHQGITVILAPSGCLTKTPSSSNSHKITQKLPIANKRDNLTPLSPYMFGSACNYRLWRVPFLSYAYHVMLLKHYTFSSYRVPP